MDAADPALAQAIQLLRPLLPPDQVGFAAHRLSEAAGILMIGR